MLITIKKFIKNSQTENGKVEDKDVVNLLFKPLISILFLLMILITFTQVIFRYILNSALPWAGEITIFFFIWVIFLGASITLHKGLHIGVDIITNQLNQKKKKIIYIFTNCLIIAFCFMIFIGSIPLVIDNFTQRSPALEIRLTFVYLSIPFSMIAMIWISIKKIIREVNN
tara:strand:- start:1789 stop:2301 length:513 start_codon:yes stop_codon:yes gene_type:complete